MSPVVGEGGVGRDTRVWGEGCRRDGDTYADGGYVRLGCRSKKDIGYLENVARHVARCGAKVVETGNKKAGQWRRWQGTGEHLRETRDAENGGDGGAVTLERWRRWRG